MPFDLPPFDGLLTGRWSSGPTRFQWMPRSLDAVDYEPFVMDAVRPRAKWDRAAVARELHDIKERLQMLAEHASLTSQDGVSWQFIYGDENDAQIIGFGHTTARVALLRRACRVHRGFRRLLRRVLRLDSAERVEGGSRVLRL